MRFTNKILDTLFVYLWTVWCAIAFTIVLIFLFPIFIIGVNIPRPRIYYLMHFVPSLASKISLFLFGIKVEIENQALINPKQQYIFVANHRSYLDPLIAAVANNNFKKYIGKAEVLKIPVLGYVLKTLNVPVQRDNKDSRKWSMSKMHEYLKDGASMVIFPEGTCNTTPHWLKEFKDGAFSLSIQTGIPLAVYTIIGAGELMPRSSLLIRPGKIKVYWNSVLLPENYSLENVNQMKQDAIDEMTPILKKYFPEGYTY
jgi:1-acyl-sn-glycerol-3-phosphate acyltransferase